MARLSFFIYSEDEDVRARVQDRLEATGEVELTSGISESSELAEALRTSVVDAVYVDLGKEPERLLEILERLPEPRPALFLGGPQENPQLLLRAMRLGAKEFFVDHRIDRDLTPILRQIEQQNRPRAETPARGGMLCVAGAKGGVGTTLVTCELAGALQDLGGSVAVVDLNLRFGDVAMYFDLRPPYSIADIVRKGEALDPTFLRSVMATHISGVRVLSAPSEIEDAEIVGGSHIERTLKLVRMEFDWVIVDLPNVWDPVALRAIDLSDQILIVTTLDVPSLTHTRLSLDLLQRFGCPEDRIRVAINRHTRSATFGPRELRELLGRDPDILIPDDTASALECVNEGKLMREVEKGGKVERSIRKLAAMTHEWITGEELKSKDDRASLVKRLKNIVMGG